MSELLEAYVASFITSYLAIYLWNKLLNKNSTIFTINNFLIVILMAIVVTFNYYFINEYLRIVFITIFFIFVIRFVYKENWKKCISTAILGQVIVAFSEFIFVFITISLNDLDGESFKNLYFAKVYTNICISIICILMVQLKSITKLFTNALKIMNDYNIRYLALLFMILLFSMNFLLALSYYEINFKLLLIVVILLILIYTYITLKIIVVQNDTSKIKNEYDNLLDKSVEYETMIDNNRRDTHENKNDLLILDSMISSRNKQAKEQIRAMIKDYEQVEKELRGDDNLYRKTLRIPSGGLRGLIYHKLLLCENLKIHYDLRIGRNINSKSFQNVSSESIRQLVKVVGVYLDNAISAVKDLDKKELDVEIFIEESYFCILVANNFQGKIDLEKLGTMGYTSKGGTHGYGLSLVKEILKNNKNLTSDTSIYRDIMTQLVKIKM